MFIGNLVFVEISTLIDYQSTTRPDSLEKTCQPNAWQWYWLAKQLKQKYTTRDND